MRISSSRINKKLAIPGGITMNKEEKGRKFKEGEIKIDYENIDVADIMGQIKKKIAQRPKSARKEFRREGSSAKASPPVLEQYETSGSKAKMKRILLKLTKPFSPLIKLFIFPVYAQFRETVLILDQTNRRLDFLSASIDEVDQRLKRAMEYTKLLHSLSHNIVVELTKLKIEEENLRLKTRIMEKDFEFLGKRERAVEKQIFK
jgi:hypothetical protein